MKPRELAILLLVAGLFYLAVASLQHAPGYMDADYYYAGGLRLAQGHGFSEMVLWNYLDNPQSLPHPSHGYWFPLASMVAAAGMWLSGAQSFFGARMLFLLIAALVAPATAVQVSATCASPAVATTPVGAVITTACGVARAAVEAADAPPALTAFTVYE